MGRKRARARESSSPSPGPPVRRSARLAGFSGREEQIDTIEPEPPPQTTTTTTPASDPDISAKHLAMKLAIPPPERVAAGIALKVPIVVTFTATDATERDADADADAMSEISGVWAFVSLMTEDQSQSLAPPRADLLHGRTTDSIHPVPQPQSGDVQTIGYAAFPDLIISEPGRYCFKINIIDMNNPILDEPFGGGRILPALHSEAFDVVDGEDHPSYDERRTETMAYLRDIGVAL